MDQLSFFDLNDRLAQISKIGDPLAVLNEIVDWSKFDGVLLKAKARRYRRFVYKIEPGGL